MGDIAIMVGIKCQRIYGAYAASVGDGQESRHSQGGVKLKCVGRGINTAFKGQPKPVNGSVFKR
jgi:hypothetical protein